MQPYLVPIITIIASIFGPHHNNYCNHMWSIPIKIMFLRKRKFIFPYVNACKMQHVFEPSWKYTWCFIWNKHVFPLKSARIELIYIYIYMAKTSMIPTRIDSILQAASSSFLSNNETHLDFRCYCSRIRTHNDFSIYQ